jgi:hypothetical protein
MKSTRKFPKVGWLTPILLMAWPLHAQITISTNRYDGARTGANLTESTLTAANVNRDTFGKLYSYPVDGSVYAQPLYVPGVTIGGVARNVLYVATMNDKVYAFDADRPGAPLWMRDFTSASVTPVPITDITADNKNIVGNIGIQSTPVIDTSTGTIYLLARTRENGSVYVQRLHALDIATGASRSGSPVAITGSASGTAPDSTPGPGGQVVTFNPKMQSQRAALALTNGVVLIAWASHEDLKPYHGWIMGYDAATLAKVATFCVTPDGYEGGIWQGGRAPTIDAAGNAYFVTGNGPWDGSRNFGNSVLKFSVSRGGMSLLSYFTPGNYETLNLKDDDLGGSSFTLLPATNLLLGGGKEGILYLLDAANLGGMTADDRQIPQRFDAGNGHVMGGPVFWDSATLGPMIYHWAEDDVLKAYRFSGGRVALPHDFEGPILSPGHPGGSLTVSANGSQPGTGIIWSSMPTNQDGIHGLVAGILRAFDAESLNQIWNSDQNAARDRVGTLMKFVPPVVVNGRVYLPSHDNAVHVYGLLSSAPPQESAPPGTISIDFVGGNTSAMSSSEAAGVVPARNWNAAFGSASSTPLTLVDTAGTTTSASVTWSAPSGTWQLPVTDAPGNARMMKGYLDTGTTSTSTVRVAGLPSGPYDVYVYADGDNKSYDRSAAYTISGPGIAATTIELTDAAGLNFGGTFTRASGSSGNYVRFAIDGSGFTLDATPTAPVGGTRRAPINGIQIVPSSPQAPPPDFNIAVSPGSRTVTRGGQATYSVSVSGTNGFSGTVALSAQAPAGGTATLNPATISGSGTAALTVTTTSATPAGSSSLMITGTSGSVSRSTSVTLTVEDPPAASEGVISVDFVGNNTPMAASETAGVIAKSHWNSAAGSSNADPMPLADDAGRITGASLTWSAPSGTWALPIVDQPGSARMMKGYLDTNSTSTTTLTLAGLAQGSYDVYVYVDGDNKSYDRGAAYTLSGPGIATTTVGVLDAANTNFGGSFTRADGSAGNYVRFSITGTGFTLTAAPTTPESGTRRAPVNGLQIVPTSVVPPDSGPGPSAAGIGIDFVGSNPSAMAADESAGVVVQANWNSAAGAVRTTPLALSDAAGAATGASVTWTANGAWAVPVTDAPGDVRLMRGYLDTSSSSVTTVTVSGLPARGYDVYVYADGDNRDFTRAASYQLSAAGGASYETGLTDQAQTNFSGTFVQATGGAGNYVKFSFSGAGFTLTATPVSGTNTTLRAPINAIQIVPR